MDILNKHSKGDIQASILASKLKQGRVKVLDGTVRDFFGHQLIVTPVHSHFFSSTLAHEIGHLFGALHVPGENNLMYYANGGYVSTNLVSQSTRQIFKITKCLDFKKGVSSLSGPQMILLLKTYEKYKKTDYLRFLIFDDVFQSIIKTDAYENTEINKKLNGLQEAFPKHAEWSLLNGIRKSRLGKDAGRAISYLQYGLSLEVPKWMKKNWFSMDGTAKISIQSLAQYYLAVSYIKIKRTEEAKNALETLIEMYPKFAMAYSSLGDCYYVQGNSLKAQEYYKKAKWIKDEKN